MVFSGPPSVVSLSRAGVGGAYVCGEKKCSREMPDDHPLFSCTSRVSPLCLFHPYTATLYGLERLRGQEGTMNWVGAGAAAGAVTSLITGKQATVSKEEGLAWGLCFVWGGTSRCVYDSFLVALLILSLKSSSIGFCIKKR